MRARVFLSSALAAAVVVSSVGAQQGPAPEPVQLPARRVILYKSGVGYFEHVGSVSGSREVAIQFTSGQLNDVLKSLTALDLDNGQISAINYNSVAPIDQRLRALRVPLGSRADALQFYNALRGARLEVRSPSGSVDGRLLGVERKTRTIDGRSEDMDTLTVVGASGAVRSVVMGPDVSIRIGEQDLRDEINRYLAVVASGRDADVRRMVLNATGTGTRRLFVSYISEVPIWKSTYRLVLPETAGEKPRLQGWAIVDNTIGEDWTNVQLSLVAGAPQSFVQELSQPHYARRPVVSLSQGTLLTPQTHAAAIQVSTGTVRGVARDQSGSVLPGATAKLFDSAGRVVATAVADASGAYVLSASPGNYRLTTELPGFNASAHGISVTAASTTSVQTTMRLGTLSETITVGASTPAVDQRATVRSGVASGSGGGAAGGVFSGGQAALRMQADADGRELGDLFEYRLGQPVTIRKDQSALVPIVNTAIEAERVSVWSRASGTGRPLRGVWLTNTSSLTLDGGTFSVIDAGAFAGEGIVEPLKPNEKRLLSYGSDLAVQVDARPTDRPVRIVRMRAHNGVVTAQSESRSEWVYRVRNEDTTPRTIIVEHPVRAEWTLLDGIQPAETTATAMRFRLQVGAKGEATLTVPERSRHEASMGIFDLDDAQFRLYAEGGLDVAAVRKALQPLLDKQAQVSAANERVASLEAQDARIVSDQTRLRENMKALRGSAEERALTRRYTRELAAQEDRLNAVRNEIRAATATRDTLQLELDTMLRTLEFEVVSS